MAPILYSIKASPAVRSVLIAAKFLNLPLEVRELDYFAGEHLKPEFLQLNPLHTVPTLDDGGEVICDSHAITPYLLGKYGRDDSLYPEDLYRRALVDQKMAFDLGTIYPTLGAVDLPYIRGEIKSLPPKLAKQIERVFDFLEAFLKNSDWIALSTFSLADIHCYTSISSLNFHLKLAENAWPHSYRWMRRCQSLPIFSDDAEALKTFEELFRSFQSCSNL
ncbi:hypothetical protein PPYR_10217 [Photinus pyralis]|uniref:Uncharacterized protein n=1 Tax=Photinus pyralis TaxID=7054 RepID=A0A1Y1LU28_PHOPY|nr:glutathione S-transferase 1-like [Photinus pyralis]KAB0796156.1 hypothetical protein PPYR_10217 [Photinus pyralis]